MKISWNFDLAKSDCVVCTVKQTAYAKTLDQTGKLDGVVYPVNQTVYARLHCDSE